MKTGDTAPDFCRQTHTGETFCLHDHAGKNVVVLYFYPQDDTPHCTREACSFRDVYEELTEAGAVVVGVSRNSLQSHQGFAARHQLPFPLISDRDGQLRKLYQVRSPLGFLPGRVTYVIDKQGIVRMIFEALLNGEEHVQQALQMVKQLQAES